MGMGTAGLLALENIDFDGISDWIGFFFAIFVLVSFFAHWMQARRGTRKVSP